MSDKKLLLDHELNRVPLAKRSRMWVVTAVLMAWVINPTPAIIGGSISASLTFSNAILAILIGALIVALYSLPIGIAGAREGWSTAMLARLSFGDKGANIVSLAIAVANIVFYGVVVGIFVATLEPLLGLEPGSFMIGGGIVFVLLMATSSFFGYKGVSLLSNISVIPMLLLFAYAAYLGIRDGGGWSNLFDVAPKSPMTLSAGITATIGIFIVGATIAADVTRYSRNGREAAKSSFLSLGLGFFIFVLMGAIAVKGTGSGDLIGIIVNSDLKWIGILLLLVSSWTSADNNVYSAGLALSKMTKLPKYYFTILTVALGAVMATTGIYNNILSYIGIIAMLIPPIGGIIAIDYFVLRKRHRMAIKEDEEETGSMQEYNWRAIAAWGIAIVFDYIVGVRLGLGASGLNGLVVGSLLYYLFNLGAGKDMAKQVDSAA